MSTHPRNGLLSWRVAAYFAANPDEELTVADMRLKWGIGETRAAQQALRSMERAGWLRCELQAQRGTPPVLVAHPGPELLRTIGAAR